MWNLFEKLEGLIDSLSNESYELEDLEKIDSSQKLSVEFKSSDAGVKINEDSKELFIPKI